MLREHLSEARQMLKVVSPTSARAKNRGRGVRAGR